MTGSLIHTDFDPLPYVLFSLASIATGVLLELRTAVAQRHFGSRPLPCGSAQQ
jgi:hypothetical protein